MTTPFGLTVQSFSTNSGTFKKSARLLLLGNCKGCNSNHKDVEFSTNVHVEKCNSSLSNCCIISFSYLLQIQKVRKRISHIDFTNVNFQFHFFRVQYHSSKTICVRLNISSQLCNVHFSRYVLRNRDLYKHQSRLRTDA